GDGRRLLDVRRAGQRDRDRRPGALRARAASDPPPVRSGGAVRTGDPCLGDRLMIGREDAGMVGPMSVAQRLVDAGVDDGEVVHALVRGLAVIMAFDAVHPELTLSDVARRTGLSRASARRFLQTLVAIGYVSFDGRLFSLRPRVLEIGQAYLTSLSL